jgi:hypothetical protein
MIDAWFKASLIMASSGPKIASKNPAFASNPLGNSIESYRS